LFQIPFLRNFISNREFGSTTRDSIAWKKSILFNHILST
jgi:hypothetical protein